MKKLASLVLAGAMAFSLAACGNNSTPAGGSSANAGTSTPAASTPASGGIEPIELTIYSPGNENSVPTKTIIEYARLVNEASDGAITLDVHHSNELGSDAESIESTRMGTIDLIFAGTSGFTSFYEKAKVLDLPFLFDSAEQAYEVTNSTKTIIEYARLVNEASDGAITLDVHHSNELGSDAESIESTRMGTIDLIFAGTSGFTSFYEKAKVLDLPFLFDSAEQAYEVTNSEIGEQIFSGLEEFGLVFLSEGDNGMRHISTTNRPVHTAADVQGLKIRVPESQLYLDVWQALGATPVALALPELALALSNGTAEAQDNATYHLVANATYDDIKYFSNINYMWMGCTMAANANTWNGLDPAVQEILKEQAKAAAKYSFDTIAADNETATKTLQDAGVEFDFEPDVQSFKDALGGDAYYDQYKDESWYDQELLDAILAEVR